jgi:hypothetical protein
MKNGKVEKQKSEKRGENKLHSMRLRESGFMFWRPQRQPG